MSDKSTIQKIIGHMVKRIVGHFKPDKIVLFGSYARGQEGPDSDVDLLIIMPVQGSKRKKSVEIYKLLAGMGLPKDIIVVTPDEVEKYRDTPGTVIQPALSEGKVLYERAA